MCTTNKSREDRLRPPLPRDRHLQTHRCGLHPASATNLLIAIEQKASESEFYDFALIDVRRFKVFFLLIILKVNLLFGFLLKIRFQIKSARFGLINIVLL